MLQLLVLIVIALSGQPAASPSPRTPVVIELFTSEGCSSCPPADLLLSKLAREQPVPGVEIIPLGMHVTYWDQLGWKDPSALKSATDRQQAYGAVWGSDRVYTPQAVIDGREELVGSDEAGVKRALAAAGKRPHLRMQLTASLKADGIYATATVDNVPVEGSASLREVFIITEDGLSSVVKRGENGGRTLQHDAVVRRIASGKQRLGTVPAEWRRDRLRVTAILQDEKTRRIHAAASVPLK